jgi:hypothetical protein
MTTTSAIDLVIVASGEDAKGRRVVVDTLPLLTQGRGRGYGISSLPDGTPRLIRAPEVYRLCFRTWCDRLRAESLSGCGYWPDRFETVIISPATNSVPDAVRRALGRPSV